MHRSGFQLRIKKKIFFPFLWGLAAWSVSSSLGRRRTRVGLVHLIAVVGGIPFPSVCSGEVGSQEGASDLSRGGASWDCNAGRNLRLLCFLAPNPILDLFLILDLGAVVRIACLWC